MIVGITKSLDGVNQKDRNDGTNVQGESLPAQHNIPNHPVDDTSNVVDEEMDKDQNQNQKQQQLNDYDIDEEKHFENDNDAGEVLMELKRMVYEVYQQESEIARDEGYKLPRKELSIADIDLNTMSMQPETSLFEIVDAWKTLIDKLNQRGVFLEYVAYLEEAFYQTADTSTDLPLITDDPIIRSKVLTLVVLLIRCVDEFHVDKSISGRFLTLLEVMLSYCTDWTPSEDIMRLWIRLMQELPPDIPAINFRRKAYRVLVSLAWVPSSKGLMEACSFEHMKKPIDFSESEPAIKSHMQRIAGGPLPRYDCVNQLLDRLKDETDVCVAITSKKQGMGKTTLAGQVASHPSIQKVFTVLWLRVRNDEIMTYERYMKYLNELCAQLPYFKKQKTPKVPWPKYIQRFEEPALRKLREQDCINQAKERMSEILQQNDRYVLLVLDDVTDSTIIERFRFFDRQSVIVTTPHPNLDAVDWTVEVVPICEEEAIELFLKEASLPENHILGSTKELQAIIEKSECNPLVVRTIARWYQLKQVTAGSQTALQEILEEITSLAEYNDEEDAEENPNQLLFDVLSLMMGPISLQNGSMSTLFVLCFAAMVVVFDDIYPLDSVLLLWDQVLNIEPMAIEELTSECGKVATDKKRRQIGWSIADGLSYMGLISVVSVNDNPWVHVHHQLYKKFAVLMASQMELKEKFEDAIADWNLAFVTAYFKKRIVCGKEDFDDDSWDYAIRELPTHICKGKMDATAVAVLSDETFFQARIEALKWDTAIEQHIKDCVGLQQLIEKDTLGDEKTLSASIVFHRTAELIQDAVDRMAVPDSDRTIILCRALYSLGFALTENGYYDEAIEHFENAQRVAPPSRVLRASILYSAGWALLANNDPDKAKKKINASRKIMDQGADLHVLYKEMLLVYANALVATCDYKEAATFFEVMVENMRADADSNPVELGTALFQKGRLNYMMGETELAKSTLEECVRWKTGINETSRSLASAYGVLGDVYMQLGNKIEAKRCFDLGIKALQQLHYNSHQLDFRLLSAKLQYLRNEFGECFKSFSVIRRTIADSPLMVLDQSAYDLRMISRIYLAHGDTAEAILVLKESLDLTSERPLSLERAWTLIEIGNCYVDESNVKEGLRCYEQALEIQVITLAESTQVVDTSNLIGSLHFTRGNYESSLSVFVRIHQVLQRICPNDVDRIAHILFQIGDAHVGRGAFAQASVSFEECLEVLRRGRSDIHADIGKVHDRIAGAAAKLNDLGKALEHYCEALRIRRMNFDERLSAETMHNLGVVQRKLGNYIAAKKVLLESLEIRKNYRNSTESAETLLELANVYRNLGELSNSAKLLSKGLEVLGKRDDGSMNLTFGHVKLAQGDFAAALSHYKTALEIRHQGIGKNSQLTANASRSVGIAYMLLEKPTAASEHLVEFLRVCDMVVGHETRDYVLATILIGDTYQIDGQLDEATESWNHAKTLFSDAESIRLQAPELGDMITSRLQGVETSTSLMLTAAEKKAIQQMIFIDD